MENDAIRTLRSEIRQFSHRIVRNDVTSEQLPAFLHALLTDELFEPHSCLRIAATEIAKRYPEMSARDVAAEILKAGRRYGRTKPIARALAPRRSITWASRNFPQPRSALPEFSLAVGFTTVGVLHLATWLAQNARSPAMAWNKWQWSATMCGGYLLAGMLFFYSALSQWLGNRRRAGSDRAANAKWRDAASEEATRSRLVRF